MVGDSGAADDGTGCVAAVVPVGGMGCDEVVPEGDEVPDNDAASPPEVTMVGSGIVESRGGAETGAAVGIPVTEVSRADVVPGGAHATSVNSTTAATPADKTRLTDHASVSCR